jgi:AcrR family transcriptional regulator
MTTRDAIIQLGDQLIRDQGYNAFSFYDISRKLKIKNASIHYYFPTKSDLGLSILKDHHEKLDRLIQSVAKRKATAKLKVFLSIYSTIQTENRVCLVGSLATDFKTVDVKVAKELKSFAQAILIWVTEMLEEGRTAGEFLFSGSARTKALLVIGNMLASLQLSRLTGDKDFYTIQQAVLSDLKS